MKRQNEKVKRVDSKVNACPECNSIDHVQVTAQSAGCQACGIYWICTTVEYLHFVIQNWNSLKTHDSRLQENPVQKPFNSIANNINTQTHT